MNFIMGLNTVTELFQTQPKRILEVYVLQSYKKDKRKQKLISQMRQKKIQIHAVSKEKLNQLTNSTSHQGIVVKVKERKEVNLESFLKKAQEKCFILILDSIFDPQNFGAILRSAECFGVDLVIWSKTKGASLTPTVAKVSSGASELLNLTSVFNLAGIIPHLKKQGFTVIGSNVSKKAKPLFDYTYPSRTALILGSEGEGVRPLLLKSCDVELYIPMQGKIDSLNVSNAAAVFLSHLF